MTTRRRSIDAVKEAKRLVLGFFNGDEHKTRLWFETPNPLLGGEITPNTMIRVGREERLLSFIQTSLQENELPPGSKEQA